jgi:hypothetical protein
MKLILVGHPGSRIIRDASLHLIKKYTPFEPVILEYHGNVNGWSDFIAEELRGMTDKYIVFALDDYLLAGPLNQDKFDLLLSKMDDDFVCARLCDSSFYTNKTIEGDLIRIEADDYTCTTQYSIWDREVLINVLEQTTTPWDFEINGSGFMNRISYSVLGTEPPALTYNTNSSLSPKWEGVDLSGLSEEDVKEVQKLL